MYNVHNLELKILTAILLVVEDKGCELGCMYSGKGSESEAVALGGAE